MAGIARRTAGAAGRGQLLRQRPAHRNRAIRARGVAAPQPGQITINQMYVQYRIPKTVSGPAIVMVHGSGHTGVTYETTPDGREGWATYFARKGFPVYVVDHSGRGRSGFDPTVINRARGREQRRRAARHPDRAARTRLVLLPHRRGLSDAVSGLAVSGRGVRPVHRAARAQRRGDARRRRRQHRAGARRAARQDRAGDRDRALAIRRLRHGPGAPRADQDAGVHQRRRQLRAGDRGRGHQDLREGADCSRCGATTAQGAPGTERRRAPQRLRLRPSTPSRRPAAPPSSCCCPRPATRATATC